MNAVNDEREEKGNQKARMVRGEEATHKPHPNPNGGEPPRDNGESEEYQQERDNRTVPERQHESIHLDQGASTSLGKILEALNVLKEEHLAYVHAHRRRLESRLDENIESENSFLQKCSHLEQEIYQLAEQLQPDQET